MPSCAGPCSHECRPARVTLILGLAGVAFAIFILAVRRWNQLNSNDLGYMSRQWLAEYNAQHP